ncbi:hypothetical protein DCCM_1998 [Desulfocucumis palustris]|uniref:Uncharacterized protein n=1 Tax=Desulfocucumis palustris TaxID=1898651 RepID=A0A2L2XG85_9FIRM|nr:hypothetical protein [Desulfocucumis palustris]GBF32901.1 hypothetical protein DCCM_1998 [Desulfocucumis palustris]
MSAISHAGTDSGGIALNNVFSAAVKYLRGFFITREITRSTSIYHGEFCYDLVPDTSIRSFQNIKNVTMLKAGDCYVYVFEQQGYQGQYRIVKPGEVFRPEFCGSIIVSTKTLSISAVQADTAPPDWCWELSGPMYLWHFSPVYRYA